jgi:cytochrome c5
MKKLIILLFICAAVAVACGKKIMPESDANNSSKTGNEKASKQPANSNTSSSSTPSFNDMKGSQTPIPDGTKSVDLDLAKTVYVTKCNGCHALKSPGDYTVDQMYAILKAEIPKAKLNSNDAELVKAYFLANAKR